jgi:hypothetical protein
MRGETLKEGRQRVHEHKSGGTEDSERNGAGGAKDKPPKRYHLRPGERKPVRGKIGRPLPAFNNGELPDIPLVQTIGLDEELPLI